MENSLENSKLRGMNYSITEMSLSVSNQFLIHAQLLTSGRSFLPVSPWCQSVVSVRGVSPSLTLKAAVVDSCDNQDSALLDVSDISRAIGFC